MNWKENKENKLINITPVQINDYFSTNKKLHFLHYIHNLHVWCWNDSTTLTSLCSSIYSPQIFTAV